MYGQVKSKGATMRSEQKAWSLSITRTLQNHIIKTMQSGSSNRRRLGEQTSPSMSPFPVHDIDIGAFWDVAASDRKLPNLPNVCTS